jgi:hypothetical protein
MHASMHVCVLMYAFCAVNPPIKNTPPSSSTPSPTAAAVTDAPVALADSATTPEDTATSIPVLSNDSDVDNYITLLMVYVCTSPDHGTAVVDTTSTPNTITYIPALNFNGLDSFTYKVSDGALDSSCVDVIITVTSGVCVRMCACGHLCMWVHSNVLVLVPLAALPPPSCSLIRAPPLNAAVNDLPVALADQYTTPEDTPIIMDLVSNDTDADKNPLVYVACTSPTNGTLVVNADGTVTYTPELNFNGIDMFTYEDSDGTANSSACATVIITVTPGGWVRAVVVSMFVITCGSVCLVSPCLPVLPGP